MSAAIAVHEDERRSAAGRATVLGAYPAAVLRVLSRDRSALFFAFLLPVALIVVIGLAFGGTRTLEVGWVDLDHGPVAEQLVTTIRGDRALAATSYPSPGALQAALDRKEVVAGLVIPEGTSAAVAAGDTAPVRVVAQTSDSQGAAAALALRAATAPTEASLAAARALRATGGGSFDGRYGDARQATDDAPAAVEVRNVGGSGTTRLNRFSQTAAQNLVLFVFMTALVSASFVVTARRQGVLQRSLSTSASPAQVLVGLCVAILVVTFVQSSVIVLLGSAVFHVDWGDPLAAAVLILATDLCAAAGGVLVGAVGRNPDRTSAMAPVVGIGLAVLGGCVIPLELFPSSLRAVAHAVPQYWAVSGWQALIFDGRGLGGIAVEVTVLLAFGAALLTLALMAFVRQLRSGTL